MSNIVNLVFLFIVVGMVSAGLIYSISSAKIQPTVNFGDNYIMTEGTQQNTTVEFARTNVETGVSVLLPLIMVSGAFIVIGAVYMMGRKGKR